MNTFSTWGFPEAKARRTAGLTSSSELTVELTVSPSPPKPFMMMSYRVARSSQASPNALWSSKRLSMEGL